LGAQFDKIGGFIFTKFEVYYWD